MVTTIRSDAPVHEPQVAATTRRRFSVFVKFSFAALLIGLTFALFIVRSRLIARNHRLQAVADQHKIGLRWIEDIPWGRPFPRYLNRVHDFVSAYFQEIWEINVDNDVSDLPPSFFQDLNDFTEISSFHWTIPRYSSEVTRILSQQRDLTKLAFVTQNSRDRDLEFLSRFSRLRDLVIDGLESKHLNGSFLRAVVGRSPELDTLYLWHVRLERDAWDNLGQLKTLGVLDLRGCQLTSDVAASLSNLSRLRSLSFDEATVDDGFGDALGSLTSLEFLSAQGSSLTSDSARSIARLSQLRALDIRQTSVDDQFGVTLSALKKLRKLFVAGSRLTAQGLQELKGCPELTVLNTGGMCGTGELLAHLRLCVRLESADIVWTGGFSANEIANFNALPDLKYLYFSDLGDAEAEHLLQCEHLTGLDIHSERLTLTGIRSLMQLPKLSYMKLAGKKWGPDLIDVLYESPALEAVKMFDRSWEWWEFEDLRERLTRQNTGSKEARCRAAKRTYILMTHSAELA